LSLKIFSHKSLSFMTLPSSLQQPNKSASHFFALPFGSRGQQQQ
jgi:hypothetical protein